MIIKQKQLLASMLILLITIILSLPGCKRAQDIVPDSDTLRIIDDSISFNRADSNLSSFYLTNYDVPPKPINNVMPVYPKAFRNSGIQGVVLLEVEVNETGQVDSVRVLKSLLSGQGGLDETAIMAVKTWSFKPATLNNKPVKAKVNIPVPFSLKQNN